MTRLREVDIKNVDATLDEYDAGLVRKTGYSLKRLAMRAVGISEEDMEQGLASNVVAVIPVTSGRGIIEGFSETVAAILKYLGANVFQPGGTDIEGLAQAIEQGATIVFCADDHRFIALHLSPPAVIDNIEATAKGYVTALDLMATSLEGRQVLMIGGAGRLGWKAISFLKKKGAKVFTYDLDHKKLISLAKAPDLHVEIDLERSLMKHRIYFDATPAMDIIRADHIKPETLIAAPGIPLGLTEEAYDLVKDRLIHDPLQIGVATMLMEAL